MSPRLMMNSPTLTEEGMRSVMAAAEARWVATRSRRLAKSKDDRFL
jgi:hypothetical protein